MKPHFFLVAAVLATIPCLVAPCLVAPCMAAPKVGPKFEVTFPLSSQTRERFGSSLSGIGVGFGEVVPKAGGRFSPDILVAREERRGNELEFYGAGLQYRRTFERETKPSATFVPFFGAGVGLAYGKVELPSEGVNDSKWVPSGSIFLGTSIGKSGLIETRLRGIGKVGGLDFSGLTLSAGVRF